MPFVDHLVDPWEWDLVSLEAERAADPFGGVRLACNQRVKELLLK